MNGHCLLAGFLIVEDEEDDLPHEVLHQPEVNLRLQFFNFTCLQNDFATGTSGSYVPLCKQYCLPAENRDKRTRSISTSKAHK